jgi:hypothetical protein
MALVSTVIGAFVLVGGGCSCGSKGRTMTDNAIQTLDMAVRCCKDMADPQAKDECLRDVAKALTEAGSLITQWTIACEQGNQALMDEILRAIRARINGQSCSDPAQPVKTGPNTFASIASPLSNVERVDMEIEGEVGGNGGVLFGTTCLQHDGDSAVCAETVVKIGWISRNSNGGRSIGEVGSLTRLQIQFPEMSGISLNMVPFEGNRIDVDQRGRGSVRALMEFAGEGSPGLFNRAWFEFPIEIDGGVLSFGRRGMSGLEVAPEVPNAVADWDGNFVVDAFDKAAFYAEFADSPFDLNGDGVISEADIAYFEQRYFENSNG